MKHAFLFILMLFSSLATWAADELTASLTGRNLSIALTGDTEFFAFQMDIYLPDDIQILAINKSDRLVSGANTTINGNSVSSAFRVVSDAVIGQPGVTRIMVFNMDNHYMSATSGDILNLILDNAPVNAAAISLSNIKFVKKVDNKVSGNDFVAVAADLKTRLGDVNFDDTIDAADIIFLINKFLTGDTSALNMDVSDMNNDGVIDAADIISLINTYLNNK